MHATTHPSRSAHGLSPAQVDRLRQRSAWRGVAVVLHAWGVIALSMAMFVVWPHVLTFVLAFVWISGRQLGLAILMHDAAHRLLLPNGRLNDWVGHYIVGGPVGADLYLYRPYHLQHHRHTQQAQDPDLELSAPFPISRASLRRKVVRDLLGVTGYQRRIQQWRSGLGSVQDPMSVRVRRLLKAEAPFLVSNAVLLGLLCVLGHAWLYLTLWLWPLLTGYQLVSRLRNIAEHAVVGPADDDLRNTRTTRANWLARMTVAPYWVNYHLEHHLWVNTPCWNLPLAHHWLGQAGQWPNMEIAKSYTEVLVKATARDHDDRGASGGRKGLSSTAL